MREELCQLGGSVLAEGLPAWTTDLPVPPTHHVPHRSRSEPDPCHPGEGHQAGS